MNPEDFYIGWQDHMPSNHSKYLRRLLWPIFIAIPIGAFLLVYFMKPFNDHKFDFGNIQVYTGVYYENPVPILILDEGQIPSGFDKHALLVGYGKFGAKGIMQRIQNANTSLLGKKIRIKGTLIYGDGKSLIELTEQEASLVEVLEHVEAEMSQTVAQNLSIKGEILDPKCWFGVMKPGDGKELSAPRRFIKVLKKIRLEDGASWGELTPYNGFHLDVEIDFEADLIGHQRFSIDMNPGAFRRELARARTFGFMSDVKKLWAAGRALGASLENTIALGDDRIINPEGLRFENEFVRHKTLDAVGDLALAGAPLLGAYKSSRGGHRLNSLVLGALFADKNAWCYVEAPRVRETGQAAEIEIGMSAANFAADRS